MQSSPTFGTSSLLIPRRWCLRLWQHDDSSRVACGFKVLQFQGSALKSTKNSKACGYGFMHARVCECQDMPRPRDWRRAGRRLREAPLVSDRLCPRQRLDKRTPLLLCFSRRQNATPTPFASSDMSAFCGLLISCPVPECQSERQRAEQTCCQNDWSLSAQLSWISPTWSHPRLRRNPAPDPYQC